MKTLARKYRPSKLDDLVGQEALVTSLKAAIANNKIGQAYILIGVRGVGKTTTARIIARSINCENGPTSTPCGVCQSCREIATDNSMDVIETDAASRTGVQDVRELIEGISYAPTRRGAKKVYIIDEAHMLSTAAWNALLKTVEEPPEHVIFIFATTEPRKIPATIQSRCQKFSLRRISRDQIAEHISGIAKAESASLEDGVAQIIAQAAEGSMRDAISILDQAISSSGGEAVRTEDVRAMIGRAAPRAMIDVLAAIAAGHASESLSRWKAIITDGIDPLIALDDLAWLIHACILAGFDQTLLSDFGLEDADVARILKMQAAISAGVFAGAQKLVFTSRQVVAANPNRSQAAEIIIVRLVQGFTKKG